MRFRSLISLLFLLFFTSPSYARFVSLHPSSPDLIISDGLHGGSLGSGTVIKTVVSSPPAEEKEEACEQTYGFMPCTKTALGNVFLILVYGFLMFTAATYLSAGSELLLEILGPGIVGGLFLPMLGALPDAMLIMVSGLSGDAATAQTQVSVGMGLLAGSTVMLLTVIWGTCTVVGKCDLRDSIAVNNQDTKGFHLKDSGVTVDVWTSYAARIMAISVIPFIIVQLPQMLDSTSGRHLAVLVALILSVTMLISYCVYQVFQPWIQRRRLAFVKHKHVISGILKHLKQHALGRLLDDEGQPDEHVIRKLFETIDANKDGHLSAAELKALIIGISFEDIDFDKDDAVGKVLQDFDKTLDDQVDQEEFVRGIKLWLIQAMGAAGPSGPDAGPRTMKFLDHFHVVRKREERHCCYPISNFYGTNFLCLVQQTKREHALLGDTENGENDEESGEVADPKWITIKAALLLLLGAAIAAAFADPLVDTVNNFSAATGIPSFFISFIALPLATNSSEAVSAIIFASRKKIRTASLTFSELCGGVTMNNILCLSVFLAIVYVRGLTWNFSSEVLVILIVCMVMGGLASFRTTYPLWTCFIAYLLYPFSLGLVYILDYCFGWS
ncbi:unnamed protein product [Eruca vesicaria subsp. sativa]|uniref:EF-hand domain-containing protein n=1 Tax=Eruca vesicaria subsp. sativa TaxID=29727 RepID=A0ABC8INZ4_ERUVS|nr:unnamed protein product [Eruca vesicaria subsp. sativa]